MLQDSVPTSQNILSSRIIVDLSGTLCVCFVGVWSNLIVKYLSHVSLLIICGIMFVSY